MIKLTCGRCTWPFLESAPAGTETRCPQCGSVVSVPSDADVLEVVAEAPPAPRPPDRLAEFQRTLVGLTPRVVVTPALIAMSAIVFILMAALGVSLTEPNIPDLLRWGADFGPKTLGGEWWRLFTCMFVHIGILHILFNMWVLLDAGPLVERMVGNVGFALLYLVSGLTGSLASLYWNPMMVSAGASGAIFGIYGALLGLLLRQRGAIPTEALARLRNSGIGFLLFNLVFGMLLPNIDMAAHIGGLAGGFLCGVVLSQPLAPAAAARRPVRNLLVAGLGAALVVAGAVGVHDLHGDVADVQAELERFDLMERKALDTFNAAVAKAQRKELADAAFADLLERDVLPEWRAARQRLSAGKRIPTALQERINLLLEYMSLRQEAWELLVQALRENNQEKVQRAVEKQQQAEAAAQRIIRGAGK